MNHEHLAVQYSCSTCAFCVLQGEDELKGNCHAGHPSDDNGFPEVVISTGWCGDHTTAAPGDIVPGVVGMMVPAAVDTILAVGSLDVGTITRVEDIEEPRNQVMIQNPIGGTPVAAHSKVDLTAINE